MRISGAFLRGKHFQNALRKVFLVQKRFQNASKFSACGGHIIIKTHLVNTPKVFFFRACGGQNHSVIEFHAGLQGVSRQAENSEFCPLQARKNTLEEFAIDTGAELVEISMFHKIFNMILFL